MAVTGNRLCYDFLLSVCKEKTLVGIVTSMHNNDLGAKGLPLTIADRDVEGNPPLAITGNTHICSTQVGLQK